MTAFAHNDDAGLATWRDVKRQARGLSASVLDDQDGANLPMIASDPYGNFIPGPNGLPQLVTAIDPNDGTPTLMEGVRPVNGTPVDASLALRVNHSFFIDVAHTANPNGRTGPLHTDLDTVINPRVDPSVARPYAASARRGARPNGNPTYDNELLNVHFACGDGRCNENIALSTIHHIFHGEHNRLVDVVKRVLLDSGDLCTSERMARCPSEHLVPTWAGLPFPVSDASQANQAATRAAIDGMRLNWNGERVFQAARFGTEMQYNRIVFDEFAPTLAGLHDVFEGFTPKSTPRSALNSRSPCIASGTRC